MTSNRQNRPASPEWRRGFATAALLSGYTAAVAVFLFAPTSANLHAIRAHAPGSPGETQGAADTAPAPRVEVSAATAAEMQIEALAQAGRFAEAVRLAETAPAGLRDALLYTACALWAIDDPLAAARYVLRVTDRGQRGSLLKHVAGAWTSGPRASELIAFALDVSGEADRRILLDAGLIAWVARDAIEAATWLSHQTTRAELDEGFAALAMHPLVLASQPALAADWAASVTDDELRRAALTTALKALQRIDPVNADRRLNENPSLDRVELNHLREILADG